MGNRRVGGIDGGFDLLDLNERWEMEDPQLDTSLVHSSASG